MARTMCPQSKLAYIALLQQEPQSRVLMLGDGLLGHRHDDDDATEPDEPPPASRHERRKRAKFELPYFRPNYPV